MYESRRKYNVNDDYFDTLNSHQYWLIGLLASDGYRGKYNQIGINQSGESGYKLISYIKELIQSDSPIRTIKTSAKDCYQIIISSDKICKRLSKFNIIKSKTDKYVFPDIEHKYINDFIAGYVEGDGCITISDNGIGCKYLCASFVGTKNFINKCHDVIPIKGKVRKHNSSNVYEIRWNGENAIKFCDWMYSSEELYHSYKYDNYIKAKQAFKNTRKEKYRVIKNKVLNDFKNNKINSIMNYSKEINIPFSTIYAWKRKWEKEGLL